MKTRFKSLFTALLATAIVAPAAQAAGKYPSRPIRVVVMFPAGGSADIVGRMVAQKAGDLSGFNFVVENRPGAGGNLALDAVATAAPDGYTVVFATPGIAINPSLYAKVPHKLSDFKAISLVGEAPLMLLARPSLGAKSIEDLVKISKKAPDAIRFGSSGNGSSSHLAAEVLRSMTGLQYLHVPYKGGGAAMTDVIGAQTDITVQPIAESLPFIRDKRLQAMGQTGRTRSPIAPDIPTIEEEGVKGYASTTWYMVAAPAKVPQEVVDTLARTFSEALRQPDLREKLQNIGVTTINGGPAQGNEFLASEAARWEKLIQAAKIRLE
ncbi:Bug family tripartite tricarboxylate transporter substrate binding protein [Achromobacter denitrificans]|uniref:Bug family tripartite tricarboxylate transporter substrate binding protein n=1 Tax=Achromobacter denitrificans TaxID=32002 RepID=UPI000F692A19|nr:tripartite tricarboxylate transporter substrate-binding protein [Achromobacter denitrificans]RSE81779.1 tripartite tricarboxylate transporter substrate binding protein [Achromobacter denitrificans]